MTDQPDLFDGEPGRSPRGDGLAAVLLRVQEVAESVALVADIATSLDNRLALVEDAMDERDQARGYQPVPAPRWWELDGEDRMAAIDRIALWVDHVYRPGFGHLAARLRPCWQEHDLCLYILDTLSELHSVLYVSQSRKPRQLGEAGELLLRITPQAADLMSAEQSSCGSTHVGRQP